MPRLDSDTIKAARARKVLPLVPHGNHIVSPLTRVEIAEDKYVYLGEIFSNENAARMLLGRKLAELTGGEVPRFLTRFQFGDQSDTSGLEDEYIEIVSSIYKRKPEMRATGITGKVTYYQNYLSTYIAVMNQLGRLDDPHEFSEEVARLGEVVMRMNWGILLMYESKMGLATAESLFVRVGNARRWSYLLAGLQGFSSKSQAKALERIVSGKSSIWNEFSDSSAGMGKWYEVPPNLLLGVAGVKELFVWHDPQHKVEMPLQDSKAASNVWSNPEYFSSGIFNMRIEGGTLFRNEGILDPHTLMVVQDSEFSIKTDYNAGVLVAMNKGVGIAVDGEKPRVFEGAALVLPQTQLDLYWNEKVGTSPVLFSFDTAAPCILPNTSTF